MGDGTKNPRFDTVEDVRVYLRERGWEFIRDGNKHEIWRAPNGRTMPLSRSTGRPSPNVGANIRRVEQGRDRKAVGDDDD